MPEIPEIPGFYWDVERSRYFRVVGNGQTTVNQRGDDRTKMEEYTPSSIARKRRIEQRATANPVPKHLLNSSSNKLSANWAKRGPGSRANPTTLKAQLSVGTATHFKPVYTDSAILNCINWDSGMVYAGSSSGGLLCANPDGFKLDPGPLVAAGITSICSNSNCFSFTQNSDTICSAVFVAGKSSQTFTARELPDNMLVQTSQWHNNKLYLATSSGVIYFDPESHILDSTGFGKKSATALDAASSYLAVGYRNGQVSWGGTRINHKSCVTNVKVVGDKLLVSGLKDRMCLYDPRQPSRPLIEYKSYHNWSCPSNGLALNPDLTLAAVAVDDGSLLIYDLAQRQPVHCALKNTKEDEAIRSILWPSAAEIFVNDGKTLSMTHWGPKSERFPPMAPSKLPELVTKFWECLEEPNTDTLGLGVYITR